MLPCALIRIQTIIYDACNFTTSKGIDAGLWAYCLEENRSTCPTFLREYTQAARLSREGKKQRLFRNKLHCARNFKNNITDFHCRPLKSNIFT